MDKNKPVKGVGKDKARKTLKITMRELNLAVKSGILKLVGDEKTATSTNSGKIDPKSLQLAAENLDQFKVALAGEERLNATQSAKKLGVTVRRFKQTAELAGLQHVETGTWTYGTIKYYRTADVEQLVGWLAVNEAERAVDVVVNKEAGRVKAAETRRKNIEKRKQAQKWVTEHEVLIDTHPVIWLRWAWAVVEAFPEQCKPTSAEWVRENKYVQLSAEGTHWSTQLKDSRPDEEQIRMWWKHICSHYWKNEKKLVNMYRLAYELKVDVNAIAEVLPFEKNYVSLADSGSLKENVGWLQVEQERYRQLKEAEGAARKKAERDRAVLKESQTILARDLTDEEVAEILGLKVESVRLHRPSSGRWHPVNVARIVKRRPGWARSDEEAVRLGRVRAEQRRARRLKKQRRKEAKGRNKNK